MGRTRPRSTEGAREPRPLAVESNDGAAVGHAPSEPSNRAFPKVDGRQSFRSIVDRICSFWDSVSPMAGVPEIETR